MDIAFMTFFIKFEKKLHGVKYYGKHTKYLNISTSHVKRIKRGITMCLSFVFKFKIV